MQSALSLTQQRCVRPSRLQSKPFTCQPAGPVRLVPVQAAADEDAELEKRLEKLRLAKGATPYGQGTKAQAKQQAAGQPSTSSKPAAAASAPAKKVYDYSEEKLHFEGGPAGSDLALNLALGTTLVWLPLTLAAVVRSAFVQYRFTDMRLRVVTTAPWKTEQLEAAYAEIKNVVTVGRAFGLCGDMVVELNNGDKVEILRVENYKELEAYVNERREALATPATPQAGKFVTQAELMGEDEPKAGGKRSGKGFA